MKAKLSLILASLLIASSLAGCTNQVTTSSQESLPTSSVSEESTSSTQEIVLDDDIYEKADEYLGKNFYLITTQQYRDVVNEFQKIVSYEKSAECDKSVATKMYTDLDVLVAKYKADFKDTRQFGTFDVNYLDKTFEVSRKSIKKKEDISDSRMAIYQHIYEKAMSVLPEHWAKKVVKFVINTDNEGGYGAMVVPEKFDNTIWAMHVDVMDNTDENNKVDAWFYPLICHEFAHIISLDDEQLTSDYSEQNFKVDYGMLKKEAYLNQFYEKFWGEEYFKEWEDEDRKRRLYDKDQDPNKPIQNNEFYNKHETDFVSKYAATNVSEDFADTFRWFVFLDEIPTDDTIAVEKINFMYEFPEFLEMRDKMRAASDARYKGFQYQWDSYKNN